MKWLNYFSNSNIPYRIYKIKKNDLIIINKHFIISNSIIILYGTMFFCKVFNNQELFPIAILNTNNIIYLKSLHIDNECYYKLIALDKTYILSFSCSYLINKKKMNKELLICIINAYQNTFIKYELINSILSHKYIKLRLVHLILVFSLEFGIVYNHNIIIPFNLPQKYLIYILNTNYITVNKIINFLIRQNIIKYSSDKILSLHSILNLSYNLLSDC